MNILGVELRDIDFLDADELEKYEAENQRVVDRLADGEQFAGKSTADSLRIQCHIVNDFFDNLFGPGTAQSLFKGKSNIKDHMEAFAVVSEAAYNARAEFDSMTDKYSFMRADRQQTPVNREQRRAVERANRNAAYGYGKNGKGNRH